MRFAASQNSHPDFGASVDAACKDLVTQLGNEPPDLLFCFLMAEHRDQAGQLPERIRTATGARHFVSCTVEGVAGGNEEIEDGPAISMWAATLPDVPLAPFHVQFERTPDGLMCTGLPPADSLGWKPQAALLLADPCSTAIDSFIGTLSHEFPGLPLLGGMASGARGIGENRLLLDEREYQQGGVGILIGPGVSIRSVVSQGCRPVGRTYVVTRSEQNVLHELGGKAAMLRLQEVFDEVSERDRQLISQGPHVGLARNEYQESFDRGDFFISNIIGGDRTSGALAIGNPIRTGQTVQFHVRDATTADEDLRTLIGNALQNGPPPKGALLFTCNGRGTRVFAEPHHDAQMIQQLAGPIPLAGFFAQGELGPISGENHIHGFTASVALFGEPEIDG
ncbi:MAG: FIST N-terminal domain-containing protein [Maioricimonas sp. JB049]